MTWGPPLPTFDERNGLLEVDTCFTSSAVLIAALPAAAAETPVVILPIAPAAALVGEPDELCG